MYRVLPSFVEQPSGKNLSVRWGSVRESKLIWAANTKTQAAKS